ncbi:MAG: PadR family transcriptional regulator [Coriobacteriia bacterium]|nr:PadR family transcriptional regulator [Coriobacteriia bacterium]
MSYQDSTGYDLTKVFKDSLNNFWHAQSAQIYRELDRMEQKGWVASQNIVQQKRPNKRLYSITDNGRYALEEWLSEGALDFEHPHEAFLMRIFFGASVPEVTLALLKACRDMCLASPEAQKEHIQANIDRYAAEMPGGEKSRLYWQMTLDFGIMQSQAVAQWAQMCIDKLEGELHLGSDHEGTASV